MLARLGRMSEPMPDANRPGPLSKEELQIDGAMSGVPYITGSDDEGVVAGGIGDGRFELILSRCGWVLQELKIGPWWKWKSHRIPDSLNSF
ncbi:hypothetical protein PHLCEN_2v1028 [Hermanssonia centrifuga]|uniref:Uncharacterized protein n=1 Tax=Hermanssonia centrifuga TaxID=98765 RepID=A0A2R6S4H7_9APHY|nr:hypothetical protein PHLCEN_2v1028 [Hermanssonia centrifuga]